MQKEINILFQILKYFNKLMDQPPLSDAQISLANSISETIAYFESEITPIITQIEVCKKTDYEKLSSLLRGLYFILRQYLMDIERFGTLWVGMWGTYCKYPKSTHKCMNIEFDKLPEDIQMNDAFHRILKVIIQLNKLDGKKIVYKKELSTVTSEITQFTAMNKKLRIFINAVIHRDKNDDESTTGYFMYIGGKLQDYCCLLEFTNQALQKILNAYSDKVDEIEAIKKYK